MKEHQPVVVAFQVLADEILATRSPRLIAVDGRAGSGKTTFATRLRRFLPDAVVVEVDSFLDWSDLDDWWPRLEKEALTREEFDIALPEEAAAACTPTTW